MPKPSVGILWDNGKIIAAIAHPPTENTTRTGTRLDSNLSHADAGGAEAAADHRG